MQLDWSLLFEVISELLKLGVPITLKIAIFGLIGGSFLGILLGLCRVYGAILNYVVVIFIEIIRGTPLLVQALYIYFVIFPFILKYPNVSAVTVGIIAIIINSAAYIAEITRGCVLSIDKGYKEAGLALGLSKIKAIYTIILPLAFRRMIPSLGNQFIISIKDTSILSIISVGEIVYQAQVIIGEKLDAMSIWTAVAFTYLMIIIPLTILLRLVERKLKIV